MFLKNQKLQAVAPSVILRYKIDEIENMAVTKGGIYMATHFNRGYFSLQKAELVSVGEGNVKTDKSMEGKYVLVDYLVSFDESNGGEVRKNANFIDYDEYGNHLRHCHEDQIYAIIEGDKFVPLKGMTICSLPPKLEEEKIGGIIIPDMAKDQKTDRRGYWTTLKFINEDEGKISKLNEGDNVYCEPNSDIPILIDKELYLNVPTEMICGKMVDGKFILANT